MMFLFPRVGYVSSLGEVFWWIFDMNLWGFLPPFLTSSSVGKAVGTSAKSASSPQSDAGAWSGGWEGGHRRISAAGFWGKGLNPKNLPDLFLVGGWLMPIFFKNMTVKIGSIFPKHLGWKCLKPPPSELVFIPTPLFEARNGFTEGSEVWSIGKMNWVASEPRKKTWLVGLYRGLY